MSEQAVRRQRRPEARGRRVGAAAAAIVFTVAAASAAVAVNLDASEPATKVLSSTPGVQRAATVVPAPTVARSPGDDGHGPDDHDSDGHRGTTADRHEGADDDD